LYIACGGEFSCACKPARHGLNKRPLWMSASVDDFKVTAVYAAFRCACPDNFMDQAVELVTGGRHVHCELVFLTTAADRSRSTLSTVASVYPHGVYASDVLSDPFYGVCDRKGRFMPVDVANGGSIGWEWLDITAAFDQGTEQRRRAFLWLLRRVGVAQYRKDTYVTFMLPCGRESYASVDDGVDVKTHYICSELVADTLFGFGNLTDAQSETLRQSCRRAMAPTEMTQKLSPSRLYKILVGFDGVSAVSSSSVRLLTRSI